jgi:hypothetical protein
VLNLDTVLYPCWASIKYDSVVEAVSEELR